MSWEGRNEETGLGRPILLKGRPGRPISPAAAAAALTVGLSPNAVELSIFRICISCFKLPAMKKNGKIEFQLKKEG